MLKQARVALRRAAKIAAARAGLHIVPNYRNPEHTLVGLDRYPIRTIFDIGANTGQFARLVRKQFPQAMLHCFEPTPAAYASLSKWARQDGRTFAIATALGPSTGETDMLVHDDHASSSSLLSTTELGNESFPFMKQQRRIKVSVQSLDDYVAQLSSPLQDELLLKLDVQGYELEVLKGARATLNRARVCITEVCLDPLYIGQCSFDEVYELMRSAGLTFSGLLTQMYSKQDGHVVSFDALFLRN